MQAHQNKGVPNREVRFQSMSRLGPFSDYFAANRSFIQFRIGLATIQESDLSTGAAAVREDMLLGTSLNLM